MDKQRNFNNQAMQHLRHFHSELMTPSGAIDGSKGQVAQDVVKQTTNILVRARILQRNNVTWEDKESQDSEYS